MTTKYAIFATNSTDPNYVSWFRPGAICKQLLSTAHLFSTKSEAESVAILLNRLTHSHITYTATRVYTGFALRGADGRIHSALCSAKEDVQEWISEHYRITDSDVLGALSIEPVTIEASKWLEVSQRLTTQLLEDQLSNPNR